MKRVLAGVSVLLLVACGGGGEPSDDPRTSSATGTTSATGTPSATGTSPATSEPEQTSPPPPGGGAPIEAFATQISISDARSDAEEVNDCAAAEAADPACAEEVAGLALSAQALGVDLENLGTPRARRTSSRWPPVRPACS